MKYNPHDYQSYCTEYLLDNPAAGLLLDMGLGKTVITLTAIDQLMFDRFEIQKPLVIAPLRVAENTWSRESSKWDHLRHLSISKVLGTAAQRKAALMRDADIYVINRENVQWLVDFYGLGWPFDMVVIDELSSFRNPKSVRFKALRKVRPLIKRIVRLTGSPTPKGLIDLWPQVYLLDMGERLFKTLGNYRQTYFTPGRRNGYVVYDWLPKVGAEAAIYARVSDICISMKAHDYLQLPKNISTVHPVALDNEAMYLYTEMEKETILALKDAVIDAGTAAVVNGKLSQIANGAVYDESKNTHELHTAKLDALEDVIESANGGSVLVYYTYQHDRDRILARFKDAQMIDDIDAWNRGEIPIMLAHPASAGHGLNLQAGGHIIVWFGITWDLELYQQANARLYRQGQPEDVTIIHLAAEGTIDEDALKALSGKANRQEALMEAVKARLERYTGDYQLGVCG